MSHDLDGTTIAGRYLLERRIGQGGMGSVWAARDVSLGRRVAVKLIHPEHASSEASRARFELEAKAAARIRSRHAVQVFDHGLSESGQPYIVMEYLEGRSLERAIAEQGALPLAEVCQIVRQAATALSAAHAAGVVHRDLKPDNVFLADDPEAAELGYTVKLVDFGIAKLVQESAHQGAATTQAGTVMGTPHYMSPESLTAAMPVGPLADVWSLGACAFVAACGSVPFAGDAIGEVVLKVCAAPLPRPSALKRSLPKAFDEWFARACSRNPEHRFGSPEALAAALSEVVAGSAGRAPFESYALVPVTSAESVADLTVPPPRLSGRALLLAGVLAGAAVAIGLVGYLALQQKREAQEVMVRTAASAAAVIEAHNRQILEQRKREAGDRSSPAPAGMDAGGLDAPR